MKLVQLATLLLVSLAITAPLPAADFGIRAGRYDDSGERFVGADLLFDLGAVNVNPNLEYSLEDDVTAGSVNLDLTFDVARLGTVVPYVGAGVGLRYMDADLTETQTDLLGNVLAGIAFDLGRLRPYAQVKYFQVLDDEAEGDDLALTLGLRF